MSRIFRVLVSVAVATAAVTMLLGPSPAAAQTYEMKIATVAPDNTPWSALLKRYKRAVEKASGGRIKVKMFLGGTLGDENESVIKCKRGQIQAVGASTGAMASQVPELNLVELPFLFRSEAESDYILDNVLHDPLSKIFKKYDLILGFWSENGYRHFGTKDKPVKKPSDLKGKKMRSQESPVHLEMWKSFGASPVPIPTTEVLTALQTGTVDGFDQAPLYAIAASWYKSIKYYTLTGHIYQPAVIAFNKKWFDSLPADLQKILLEEGKKIQDKGRKAVRKINPELLEILKGNGVTIYQPTEAELRVFEKESLGVRKDFRKRYGKEASRLLDEVEKALAKLRK